MKKSYSSLMGLLTIAAMTLAACKPKVTESAQMGITESSARQVANEVCSDFASWLRVESSLTPQNIDIAGEACRGQLTEIASGPSGMESLKDESFPTAFTVINEVRKDIDSHAPFGYEGDWYARHLTKELREHGGDLVPCVLGSSPECR